MLGRVLRLADYRVAVFKSGAEFLDSLATGVPACVILDVHMPGLSGFEVQSKLLASHTAVPVIFITASDDPALDKTALEAKGRALLRKPFSSDQLLGALAAAVPTRAQGAP